MILLPFKGFADQYFCESQSNYDVRISDGRLIQNKIPIREYDKKFKMEIIYPQNIHLTYFNESRRKIKYKIIRNHNGIFGVKDEKGGPSNMNHSISFNKVINTVSQYYPGLQSISIIISKCKKL